MICNHRDGAMIRGMIVLRAAMLGVGLIAAAGCGDDCKEGATRCSSGSVQTCSKSYNESNGTLSSPHWSSLGPCPASMFCIMPPGQDARCDVSSAPDPLCQGVSSYCSGDSIVPCIQGYRGILQKCGVHPVDPSFTHCVATGSYATCVPPEAMPNAACPPAGSAEGASPTMECVGNVALDCRAGLVVATTACGSCGVNCRGFLGDDTCDVIAGGQCAPGLSCHPDSTGASRCTAACDAADPNAVQGCQDLDVAGGPAPSSSNPIYKLPGQPSCADLGMCELTCTAGFCEWAIPGMPLTPPEVLPPTCPATCGTPAGADYVFTSAWGAVRALVGLWQICPGGSMLFPGATADTIGVEFGVSQRSVGAPVGTLFSGNMYYLVQGSSGPVRAAASNSQMIYETQYPMPDVIKIQVLSDQGTPYLFLHYAPCPQELAVSDNSGNSAILVPF